MSDEQEIPIPDLRMDSKSAKLIDWSPGQTIHVLQPPFPLKASCILIVVFVTVFGGTAFFLTQHILIAAVAGLTPGLFLGIYSRRQMPGREVILEWGDDTVHWYEGRPRGTGKLSHIKSLVLRTESGKSYDESGMGKVFKGVLETSLQDQTITILESPWEDFESDGERCLRPFATALSQALNVPLHQSKSP